MIDFLNGGKKRLVLLFADGSKEFILNLKDTVMVSVSEEIVFYHPYLIIVSLCDSTITVNGKNVLE